MRLLSLLLCSAGCIGGGLAASLSHQTQLGGVEGALSKRQSALQPYASPKGLGDDISKWLEARRDSEVGISKKFMLANIDVPNSVKGSVIAAQSYTAPNYAFHWVRDAALTMSVVEKLYQAAASVVSTRRYEQLLFDYAQLRVNQQSDATAPTGLGEVKFELASGKAFTGPWGRPQNDGPALTAVTLAAFANAYLAKGGDIETVRSKIWAGPVRRDLLYVADNWQSASFDLWEELSAQHFYTRLVQHRSLVDGAALARRLGDTDTAGRLDGAAAAIAATADADFWDERRQLLVYEKGPVQRGKDSYKDIAVILAILHGYAGDRFFSYTSEQVLSSAFQISTSFLSVFPVSRVTTDDNGAVLGIPVGRYPEDVYNGNGMSTGNPWFLATAAMAEYFYRALAEFRADGKIVVTGPTVAFWNYFAPASAAAGYAAGSTFAAGQKEFGAMTSSLEGWADAFLRRVQHHAANDGRLTEQFNRDSGLEQGAADLTWSYAALLTAAAARADYTGNSSFLAQVAEL